MHFDGAMKELTVIAAEALDDSSNSPKAGDE
jgi:hypothetical protein